MVYHKASKHSVISKLMHYFYIHSSSSYQWFDQWDINDLLSLLDSWALASSCTNFKLAWKTADHLALFNLLHADDQQLFLQHHTAIFIPASGSKTGLLGHLPPPIGIGSHSSNNLCLFFFYIKA